VVDWTFFGTGQKHGPKPMAVMTKPRENRSCGLTHTGMWVTKTQTAAGVTIKRVQKILTDFDKFPHRINSKWVCLKIGYPKNPVAYNLSSFPHSNIAMKLGIDPIFLDKPKLSKQQVYQKKWCSIKCSVLVG
jgi:hypothetical protein